MSYQVYYCAHPEEIEGGNKMYSGIELFQLMSVMRPCIWNVLWDKEYDEFRHIDKNNVAEVLMSVNAYLGAMLKDEFPLMESSYIARLHQVSKLYGALLMLQAEISNNDEACFYIA